MNEKTEFFINAGGAQDNEDLMDELNDLEAEMAGQELEDVEIGSGYIEPSKANVVPNKQPANKQREKTEEEILNEMMAA